MHSSHSSQAQSVVRQDQEAAKAHAQIEIEQRQTLIKISQFIWLGFGVLEGLLGLRILLKLIAANPQSPFAHLIYAVTQPFLAPFVGLTPTPAANGVVLEINAIIALFVYALISLLVERLIWIIFSRPRV
jgi:YggT family protein